MRSILLVLTVALLLLAGTTSTASAVVPPHPGVVCAGCTDGGGVVQGCDTEADGVADGFNNYTAVVVTWCWYAGSITYFASHTDVNPQWPWGFVGWEYDYDYNYGWQAGRNGKDEVGWLGHPYLGTSGSHRCIYVDGWGGWGVCRAWYE